MATLKDLSGQQFGYWTVITKSEDYISPKGSHQSQWVCRCICGNEKIVIQSSLKSGRSSSCGCMSSDSIHKKISIVGQRFGLLTVEKRVDDYISPKGARVPKWHCKCDCGNEVDVISTSLKNGDTKSCGCISNNITKNVAKIDPASIIGKTFGFVTVISINKYSGNIKGTRYNCKCQCGNFKDISYETLTRNKLVSCGCERKSSKPNRHKKPKAIIGERFGNIKIIDELEPHITPNGSKQRIVVCKCDCGNIFTTRFTSAKNSKKCIECSGKERRKDISGLRFGRLLVESMAEDYISPSGHRLSRCNCICDCGKKTIVNMSELITGCTTSCGCYKLEVVKTINNKELLAGQRFGNLTIVKRVADHVTSGGNIHHKYECLCDCGKIIEAQRALLINGNIKSCGCMKGEMLRTAKQKDLANKRFGHLTVCYQIDDYIAPSGERRAQWKCRCDCGNYVDASSHSLTSGNRVSCGCQKMSIAETIVNQYLQEQGYILGTTYDYEKRFTELTGISGDRELSYDFAIYNYNGELKALIECQGRQHYEPVEIFGGSEQFEIQKLHDELKSDYAKEINIPLIEVSYTLKTYQQISDYLKAYKI